MIRETIVPSIPDIRDDNIKEVLRAIKNTLDVREGNIGDPLDQAVTLRELKSLNLVDGGGSTDITTTRSLPVSPVLSRGIDGYNPSTDFTTPPIPTGLRARGGLTNVYLEWNGAPYRNHAYTEIWRSTTDNLGSAVLVGSTIANVYSDPVSPDTQYFYWIRFVSLASITGPYNATSGTTAKTAFDVATYLPALQDEIGNSQLFIDLGTRIAATETGIQTLQSVTATSASQITTLSSVVGNNSSAIQIQSSVTDGLSAQYTVKIDANGHVSGFGLASSSATGTPTSAFIVRADRFAIVGASDTTDPLGTLTPTKKPFVVLTTPTVIGGKTYPAGTWMDSAFIANATIGTAQISDLTADKITAGSLTASIGITTGQIYGGVNTANTPGSAAFGTGFFLGALGGINQFFVGSPTTNMRWDGSSLAVKGIVYATAGSIGGINMASNSLYSGQVSFNSGAGFYQDSAGKLSVGNGLNKYISWDGSNLNIASNGLSIQNGSATFSGALNAATGTFAGSLAAGVVDLTSVTGTSYTYDVAGTYTLTMPYDGTVRFTIAGGGGGGGGGQGSTYDRCDVSGLSGDPASKQEYVSLASVPAGSTITVVVGAGGAGGVAGAVGSAGGATQITVTYPGGTVYGPYTAAGGAGGTNYRYNNNPDSGLQNNLVVRADLHDFRFNNPGDGAGWGSGQSGLPCNNIPGSVGGFGGFYGKENYLYWGSITEARRSELNGLPGVRGGGGGGGMAVRGRAFSTGSFMGYRGAVYTDTTGATESNGGKGGDGYAFIELFNPNSVVLKTQFDTLKQSLNNNAITPRNYTLVWTGSSYGPINLAQWGDGLYLIRYDSGRNENLWTNPINSNAQTVPDTGVYASLPLKIVAIYKAILTASV